MKYNLKIKSIKFLTAQRVKREQQKKITTTCSLVYDLSVREARERK